ncbi:ROK family protein [Paenibacillus macerans]|uniref:ROK family protein n=1 Tax=Paenibacillus macerans TaxID=44252 RepID=UPI002041A422|nr:ROK family protein [Paenibacillus macerans]MCM3701944.1 ROK family protein [Paenibacillus macerans]
MGKNNSKILKEANKYLVLQCISSYQPITVEDIVKKTNLSRPTVINSVKELTDDHIVMKGGLAESTGGRAAALLAINADAYYGIGIDFEFPQVRIAIANSNGEILAAHQYHYPLDSSVESITDQLSEEIARLIEKSGVDRGKIEGIGLGISGVVDKNNGLSKFIERINNWHDVDIKSLLENRLNLPVYVRNDVHLMALVEQRFYLSADNQDFIYIGLRSGVGSAIFMKNGIFGGENGNAGFIGQMILDVSGPEGLGGPRGSLNVFASELNLIRRYRERSRQSVSADQLPLRLEDLVRLSQSGDELAASLLHEAGHYLGLALVNLARIFEIPNFVIGGCPNLEGSILLESLQKTVGELLKEHFSRLSIVPGQLLEREYALGGCYLVFDHIFHKPRLKLQI